MVEGKSELGAVDGCRALSPGYKRATPYPPVDKDETRLLLTRAKAETGVNKVERMADQSENPKVTFRRERVRDIYY